MVRGLIKAIQLIVQMNPDLVEIVTLSLYVSGMALLFSTVVGVPLGALLGLNRFPGHKLVVTLLYTGMGLPPVVVGLMVYLFLSRNGPLGRLDSPLIPELFTPGAMIVAQSIISFPSVAGLTMTAVMGIDPKLRQQLMALGATPWQAVWTMLIEARTGVMAAIIAGFGSIISEVGAVMLVGGNIEGRTRVLTTAILLETRKGAFDMAIALALILLGLSFCANFAMLYLQGTGTRRWE